MNRKSFVLYTASKGIIDELNIEQAGTLFKSILELMTDGEPLDMDLPTKIVFKTICEYLERDFESYQTQCKVNRINGSKGGRPKGSFKKPNETEQNRSITQQNLTVISENLNEPNNTDENRGITQKNIDYENDYENDYDHEETIMKRATSKKQSISGFEPPTIEEVRKYIQSNGYSVDPEAFWDYYTERDWIRKNGSPVKNWKKCVDTWHRNSGLYSGKTDKGVNRFEGQRNNYSKIEDETFG